MRSLVVERESWPIDGSFTISRGTKTSAHVVTAHITDNGFTGRGECVPYARYGETLDSVVEQIELQRAFIENDADKEHLQSLLPAGAARNALDCALWDLAAKQAGKRVWELADIAAPASTVTAYTLSLDTPDNMHAAAIRHSGRPLLKLKLAGAGDIERVTAVREGAPDSRIIVDANEGWTIKDYDVMVPKLLQLGVSLIEQPLPVSDDAALASVDRPIKLCADESCHDTATLDGLRGRYDVVNIKLDKTGGLTEALALQKAALELDFEIMVGCMVATSLAMAPATLLTTNAIIVDLDGPLLLGKDRPHALDFKHYSVAPPVSRLWG